MWGYGGAAFGITAGSLTVIALMYLIHLYDDMSRDVLRMTMLLLFVFWAIVAGVCTFYGPFLLTSKLLTLCIIS